MASIGKFFTSALTISSEVQASLAAVNFDFALLKVAAPVEYASVGNTLTRLRKQDAEEGSSHITARKLAALFESEVPSTPNLFKKYGIRVSEIAASPKINPQGTSEHGAFAAHVGADGTSIWAAATSGKEALALHLLACLLARIWQADEAVSIWTELVKERRKRLEEQIVSGTSFHAAFLYASKIEIGRAQLTEWDASARSWLSTADRAKQKQQVQLRLVIDNMTIPVKSACNVYDSVLDTWTETMKLMEEVLSGKALRVQNGALLLGLSAWHIYPDLSVTSYRTIHVAQKDDLVPDHALITIGLSESPHSSGSGICWSLPLAHLRHYGTPIVRTKYAGLGESRVPFEHLLYLALGSTIRSWQIPESHCKSAMKLICTLWSDSTFARPWLAPLHHVCKNYDSFNSNDKGCADRLISLGYRHGSEFIAAAYDWPAPVFGLTDIVLLLNLCTDADSRIKLLRFWARSNTKVSEGAVIRYYMPNSSVERFALVEPIRSKKRKRKTFNQHQHAEYWVHETQKHNFTGHKNLKMELTNPHDHGAIMGMLSVCPSSTDDLGVVVEDVEDETSTFYIPYNDQIRPYHFLAGSLRLAAVFIPGRYEKGVEEKLPATKQRLTPTQLQSFLAYQRSKGHSKDGLRVLAKAFWDSVLLRDYARYTRSLQTLDWAHNLYQHLPEAYVDLRVRTKPLHEALFGIEIASLEQGRKVKLNPMYEFDVKTTFSCLAYFDTGFANILPADLRTAMAISYQESIYVARKLLQDPTAAPATCPVKRIAGNVGKPGLCILHPPVSPEMKKFNIDTSWRQANYHEFDGKYEDLFTTTSLHLSFTGSSVAYDTLHTAAIHHDIHFIETLIQAYEKSEWIADLDILGALKEVQIGWPTDMFNHKNNRISQRMCTIASWDELLDTPPSHGIFPAHHNWMARLAAVTILAQLGRTFRVVRCEDRKPSYIPAAVESFQANDSCAREFDRIFGRELSPEATRHQGNLDTVVEEHEAAYLATLTGVQSEEEEPGYDEENSEIESIESTTGDSDSELSVPESVGIYSRSGEPAGAANDESRHSPEIRRATQASGMPCATIFIC